MPGRKDWIFVPPEEGYHIMENEYNDISGHGTCMLSKAAGFLWGVAKSADVVIVKMPVTLDNKTSTSLSVLIGGLSQIAEDIAARHLWNSIITIAWSKSTLGYDTGNMTEIAM